jgi:hypothetical protein
MVTNKRVIKTSRNLFNTECNNADVTKELRNSNI